ncbi:MAG: hypothetical protein ABI675_20060 [Chitinophagaceae bacterium]
MSSVVKDKIKIYQAVISSPGMAEKCKIGIHMSRQTIFILCRIIESGLKSEKEGENELLTLLSKEAQEEVQTVVAEFLRKSDLTDFYEKLKSL